MKKPYVEPGNIPNWDAAERIINQYKEMEENRKNAPDNIRKNLSNINELIADIDKELKILGL